MLEVSLKRLPVVHITAELVNPCQHIYELVITGVQNEWLSKHLL